MCSHSVAGMAISWRTRLGTIALIYLLYLIAAVIGIVLSTLEDDARPGLFIALTVSSLHFLTATIGAITRNRVALRGAVLQFTLVADWLTAAALGMTSVFVSRPSAKDEREVATTACILLAAAQLACFQRFFIFTDANLYDQESGESLDDAM